MTDKRFTGIIVLQSTMTLLLLFFLFGWKKENDSIPITALNRISNENLYKVIEHFIDTTKDWNYNFVTIYDITNSEQSGFSYCITYSSELSLIANDLRLNVICEKIKGKEIIFRPINYANDFIKSVDTIMVHYLMKYNPNVANTLKNLIVRNHTQEDRDILNVTGPIIPKIIVHFNNDGTVYDISYDLVKK